MSSMIIARGDGTYDHHTCPSCFPDYSDGTRQATDVIPQFYSDQHAKDEGWRLTNDQMFLAPGNSFVWVCPKCWLLIHETG